MRRLLCFLGLHNWCGFDSQVLDGVLNRMCGIKNVIHYSVCSHCRQVRLKLLPEMSPSDLLGVELSPLADIVLGDRPKECGEA